VTVVHIVAGGGLRGIGWLEVCCQRKRRFVRDRRRRYVHAEVDIEIKAELGIYSSTNAKPNNESHRIVLCRLRWRIRLWFDGLPHNGQGQNSHRTRRLVVDERAFLMLFVHPSSVCRLARGRQLIDETKYTPILANHLF